VGSSPTSGTNAKSISAGNRRARAHPYADAIIANRQIDPSRALIAILQELY
jgi:hypothetical protein